MEKNYIFNYTLLTILFLSMIIAALSWPQPTAAYSYSSIRWTGTTANYFLDIAGWDPTLIVDPAWTWNITGSKFRFRFITHSIYGERDDKNDVTRFLISNENRQAITYERWNSNKYLLEVNTIFNMKFSWGCCGEPNLYDVRNAITHEFGHWLMLNDLYSWFKDRNKTMYGYTVPGETKKRSLEPDDINGIKKIYGS